MGALFEGSAEEFAAFEVFRKDNIAKYRGADGWINAVRDFRRQTHGKPAVGVTLEKKTQPIAQAGEDDAAGVRALYREGRAKGMTYGNAQRQYMAGKRAAAATAQYAEPVTPAPVDIHPGGLRELEICRRWLDEIGGGAEAVHARYADARFLISRYMGEEAGPLSPAMKSYEKAVGVLTAADRNRADMDYSKFKALIRRYLAETKGTSNV